MNCAAITVEWEPIRTIAEVLLIPLVGFAVKLGLSLNSKVTELVNQRFDEKLAYIQETQEHHSTTLAEHALSITALKQHKWLNETDGLKLFVTEKRFSESEDRRDRQLELIARKQDKDLEDNAAQTKADEIILSELREVRKRIDRKFDGGNS